MQNKEIENMKEDLKQLYHMLDKKPSISTNAIKNALQYIDQLETREKKMIEKLEERIKSIEKCYKELIEPYYDKSLNILNVSYLTKKEKEEFINKRNCLIVQKTTYEEILQILKGEKECQTGVKEI